MPMFFHLIFTEASLAVYKKEKQVDSLSAQKRIRLGEKVEGFQEQNTLVLKHGNREIQCQSFIVSKHDSKKLKNAEVQGLQLFFHFQHVDEIIRRRPAIDLLQPSVFSLNT